VEAQKLYEDLITANPLDRATWKRKASLQRTIGNIDGAIQELNSYLGTFQDDLEVWEELSDIYLSLQQFARAAYCYEEVLLASPENCWVVLRYGEMLYSAGGSEKMMLARKYFIQALVLNDGCVRAMWALLQCTGALGSGKTDPHNAKIREKTVRCLKNAYQKVGVDITKFIAQ
jgi:ER membrane protein complex subunit 2